MPVEEARAEAERLDLDLVEVAPNVRPPVCRIMDYGKFRYEQSKKKSASSAAKVEIKEIDSRGKLSLAPVVEEAAAGGDA